MSSEPICPYLGDVDPCRRLEGKLRNENKTNSYQEIHFNVQNIEFNVELTA